MLERAIKAPLQHTFMDQIEGVVEQVSGPLLRG
jgi:hypothetical protein